jgi:acetyl esterase/lipase
MMQSLPRLDPELETGLDAIPDEFLLRNIVDFDNMPATRERLDDLLGAMMEEAPDRPSVTADDRVVPTPAVDVPVRVYRPVDIDGPLPCMYWIHGGGMVMGGLDQDDPTCEMLVDELGCVVVSVDYRLAPEHPYPAPVDDCYAGLQWVAASGAEIGVDTERIAIGGQSAGGGLSAATALRARDEDGPGLCHQMLIYPMLDDRNETTSSQQVTDIGIWDRDMNLRAWDAYLGEHTETGPPPVYAAPARATDLVGLPPAFVDIGTHDAFRDETISYVQLLMASGVPTEFHVWPGAFHAYDTFLPDTVISERTWATRLNALEQAFTT